MKNNMITVLITDHSLLFRNILKNELNKDPYIDVIGTAVDAMDAMEKIKALKPDIITLDVEMPKIDGLTFLKRLMAEYPMKVVLVSSMNINVFDALNLGAVDFVKKPSMSSDNELQAFIKELKTKIKVASIAKLVTYKWSLKQDESNDTDNATREDKNNLRKFIKLHANTIVAIGASTGGTEATLKVLKELPANFPPILITQHMPAGFTKMYADRLNKACNIEVREAVHGDKVKQGTALIAPGEKQMILKKDSQGYYVDCRSTEKVNGHCPSVDVLFNSVAETAKKNSVGIILTGMGRDGTTGLLNMKKAGAYTIGQNEKTSVVYGMPMVAFNIGAVMVQASIEDIPNILTRHLIPRGNILRRDIPS
jgi:two-component system chemotaxis response regulator CheB